MGMGPTFAKVEWSGFRMVDLRYGAPCCSVLDGPSVGQQHVSCTVHISWGKNSTKFPWRWVTCTTDGFDWIGLIGWDADWHMPRSGFQSLFLAATP